jgi:RimJ/RimL family protein N-acetyltransferase
MGGKPVMNAASRDLLTGALVYLTVEDAATMADLFCSWHIDSEYARLLDSVSPRFYSKKATQAFLEKEFEKEESLSIIFIIRTLADDRMIGFVDLDGVLWNQGDAFVGIGLGERQFWGKGYGTDAMRILLRFAFSELNLHRVSLNVFEFNPRAIHSYEKAGFKVEGRARKLLNRDGQRWDLIFMGILRREWEALQQPGLQKGANA